MFLGQKLFIRPLAGLNTIMKEHVLKIKGKRYQFLRVGTKKRRLVLLHGLAADKGVMAGFCRPLTERYSCLIPDLPGHNGIEMKGIDCLDSYAFYVKELIDKLGWKEFGIVGFSFGGVVGLRVAELYSKKGKIIPTVLWASPLPKEISRILFPIRVIFHLSGALPKELHKKISSSKIIEKGSKLMKIDLPEAELGPIARFDNSCIKVVDKIMKAEARLADEVPKLVVYGTNDRFVGINLDFILGDHNIKNTAFRIVENGGHFGTKAGQGEAIREIIEFLRFSEF